MVGFVNAKEPEYEVTIHIVYNSMPASEIADLVQNQLRKHKNACKVDIKIKNLDVADDSNLIIHTNGTTVSTSWD